MGWRLFEAREEEIREFSLSEKTSKHIEEEVPLEPGMESQPESKGFPCCVCNFVRELKNKFKNCLSKAVLFNKMSITEEEKKSLED
ncbi:hypothetical protein [Candidatus Mycoplasma haematominutum]|uniref:Uncharacterized protein n=1 Tax=Candidatus Mycoplasma haematominutum 'Birmingham 1' TaxID=1116213 RepID=G8C2N4_9MOLU|nr:hypothetical protein [Candidatus Mycoplasma haematominutum]CCE66582.1 hypothetical protein MHM_00640 [Candidatus Mycoplasma haematominutum 'Birmingham 1']